MSSPTSVSTERLCLSNLLSDSVSPRPIHDYLPATARKERQVYHTPHVTGHIEARRCVYSRDVIFINISGTLLVRPPESLYSERSQLACVSSPEPNLPIELC